MTNPPTMTLKTTLQEERSSAFEKMLKTHETLTPEDIHSSNLRILSAVREEIEKHDMTISELLSLLDEVLKEK